MKASDIPYFPTSYYSCDVSWDFIEDQLKDYRGHELNGSEKNKWWWFKEETSELVLEPDFQRGHVWTQEQQIAYLEYSLRGGLQHPIFWNHPNWMNSFEGQLVLVDGKQRLNAIRKFRANEISVFDGHFLKDFEDRARIVCSQTRLKFSIAKLQTKQEVLQWYVDLNSGGTPHTKEEIDKVKNMINSV